MRHGHRTPARIARALVQQRIVRFALVGGLGIPVNLALLWLIHELLGLPVVPAWILAFECSSLINFYANQRFTYREQQHLRGWDWPRRALKAQLSTLLGVAINVSAFGIMLAHGLPYLVADAAGIVAAVVANFALAHHFVFTPPRRVHPPSPAQGDSPLALELLDS